MRPYTRPPTDLQAGAYISSPSLGPTCATSPLHPDNGCCDAQSTCAALAPTMPPPCLPAEQLSLASWRSELQLYNTLTRQKETFQPRPGNGDNVQMYVCGVTVYDYSHIGHARVYVAFDVLYRLLCYLRYEVQYVRNFTDIDDKIIKRANEAGEDPLALSARFIEEFHKVRGRACGQACGAAGQAVRRSCQASSSMSGQLQHACMWRACRGADQQGPHMRRRRLVQAIDCLLMHRCIAVSSRQPTIC
jgi:hypothetical protein